MTTFTRATDLPAAIAGANGLEELKVWVDACLARLYSSREYEETTGAYLQPVIDYSVVRTADGKVRMITRSAIEISEDYLSTGTGKFWTFAVSLGDVAIPNAFKVD